MSDGTTFLNTPPTIMEEMPPATGTPRGMPGAPPPQMPPMPPGMDQSTEAVGAAIARATATPEPQMEEAFKSAVELPGGWILDGGAGGVATTATVRELTGFDEEALAKIGTNKSVPAYVTAMLHMAVEEIGGIKPSKEMLQSMLIGDRDALVLGVREATYGPSVEFTLTCFVCSEESAVTIGLDEIETKKLEDPMVREWDFPIRKGSVRIKLLNGLDQEAFNSGSTPRTQAEIDSITLARSVVAINNVPTFGDANAVRGLPAGDRLKILEFVVEKQPGPQMNKDIPVPCANCGKEHPISLGWGNLFRL